MPETADPSVWKNFAQPWELGWWTKNLYGHAFDPVGAAKASAEICNALDITPDLIRGRVVMDVGNGPTGRLQSLRDAKAGGTWIGLDPLNEHYLVIQRESLSVYDRLIAAPCETLQPDLVGQCDVIVSLNALDHGYDLPLSLANLWAYLKPGGRAVLSFDCFDEAFDDFTHPIRISRGEADRLIRQIGFKVTKQNAVRCYGDRENWGGGVHQHWWLKRPR
jgi:SAM-dependent methyltransferase